MSNYKEHIQLEGDMYMLESSVRHLKARLHVLEQFPIWACDDIKGVIKQLNELTEERKDDEATDF